MGIPWAKEPPVFRAALERDAKRKFPARILEIAPRPRRKVSPTLHPHLEPSEPRTKCMADSGGGAPKVTAEKSRQLCSWGPKAWNPLLILKVLISQQPDHGIKFFHYCKV